MDGGAKLPEHIHICAESAGARMHPQHLESSRTECGQLDRVHCTGGVFKAYYILLTMANQIWSASRYLIGD